MIQKIIDQLPDECNHEVAILLRQIASDNDLLGKIETDEQGRYFKIPMFELSKSVKIPKIPYEECRIPRTCVHYCKDTNYNFCCWIR